MRIEAKAQPKKNVCIKKNNCKYIIVYLILNFIDPNNYMMYHEIYSEKELNSVKITHKKFESWHDRVAYAAVRTLRFFFDTFTGYIHESGSDNGKENHRSKNIMTEKQWLRRLIFLESIAGVPGMVAGMSRHMKSLRKR